MALALARVNAVRQVVKDLLDDAEAQFPGDTVLASIHNALADVDEQIDAWASTNLGGGVAPLDGQGKTP